MKARCKYRTGAALGVPERGNFYTASTEFDIEVGKSYPVLGLGVFETVILVLICDENRLPSWLPVGAFDFDASKLPREWLFQVYDGYAGSGGDASNRWVARWGYEELVRNPSHSDGLVEQDSDALCIFFREVAAADVAAGAGRDTAEGCNYHEH